MARVISVSNRKGGSGKTTTTVNLAAALALKGKKVLVVDADPQAHTTLSFGTGPLNGCGGLGSVLEGKREAREVLRETSIPRLTVLPASRRLVNFERSMSGSMDARTLLASEIDSLHGDYDYTFIDTPPTMSLLTVSSLVASREVYVPLQTHFLALEGLAEMVNIVGKINSIYGNDLRIKGVIPTFYREHTRLSKSVVRDIRATLGDGIILHPVRVSVALAEAPGFGKSIFQYRLKSNGARDYLALANQIENIAQGDSDG